MRARAIYCSLLAFMSVRLGEAMREGSAAPVRKLFEGLGISFETDEIYLMAATTSITRLINQGLHGSEWRMKVNEPADIRLAYSPLDLVSAAYADLAALVVTKAEFKECPGSGRVFLPGSGKQKYHDPQCATRSRQRRGKQGRLARG
jgi:hypothetical protein